MESLLFQTKKVLSAILDPVGLVLVLWCVGMIVWRRKPHTPLGHRLVLAGGVLLLITSFPITAFLLIFPLERQAGPYTDPHILREAGVQYIVVLGGGAGNDVLSPADRVGGGLFRVMEGFRIWQGLPDSQLILSGMGFPPGRTKAETMTALPRQLGVPKEALVLETRAWDTEDEAHFFAPLVAGKRFALVTSAYHMPRAMRLFEALGLNPIPAPCEFKASRLPSFYEFFVPSTRALFDTQVAIHEYVGIIWASIKRSHNRNQ